MRFESKHEPLATMTTFVWRVIRHFTYGALIIAAALAIGMCGYHYFEGLDWRDAFLNASMILSNMGYVTQPNTVSARLFAAF